MTAVFGALALVVGGGSLVAAVGGTAQAAEVHGASSTQQAPGATAGHSAHLAATVVATYDVTTTADSGAGSLRTAIQQVNATTGGPTTVAVVQFTVTGVISLTSALPSIVRPVLLQGTTAPGYTAGGPPVVEIDFQGNAGLQFATGSAGSQLVGLAIDGASGAGVTLTTGHITVLDNYIGLDLGGATEGNAGPGILATATSSYDVIGSNPSQASGVVSNVISGNAGDGIDLQGSSNDTVAANRIGTDPAGTGAMPNGGNGITLSQSANGNEIGGTVYVDSASGQANNPTGNKGSVTPVFVVPPLGNQISGNAGNGVMIDGGSGTNSLSGNFVGTTPDGDQPMGNAGDGVLITGADGNSLLGCTRTTNPFVYYNVVSGNGRNGLEIDNSNNTVIWADFFGAAANNTTTIPNGLDGILAEGTSTGVTIGGVLPLGNVTSGNGENGIEIRDQVRNYSSFNSFSGLLAFRGTRVAPNGNDGILITSTGGNGDLRTSVYSANANNGIELSGDATGVTVEPVIDGLETNGKYALGNGGNGLLISGTAHGNVIGGKVPSVIRQNTFSGNTGFGIAIVGQAHDNQVLQSYAGVALFGQHPIPNRAGGVLVAGSAYDNTIGDTAHNPSNVISGNTGGGVLLTAGSHGNLVVNNYIGLDATGRPMANGGAATRDVGTGNTFRGNTVYPPPSPTPVGVKGMATTPDGRGYWLVGSDGGVYAYGDAQYLGSMGGQPLNEPVVGIAATPDGGGYWEVASDGGIFAFGDAQFYGSMGGQPLNKPVVGIAAAPTGKGYWEVASDGGIFAFGSAQFYGSMGGKPLNEPVVGIAATPAGQGYWEVASDGGIFAFGDAQFHGSMGGQPLNEPVVGMAATPGGGGYWEVASDGGVFSFDAPYLGSTGGMPLAAPVVAISAVPSGQGYRMAAEDGGVFNFGDAIYYGSAATPG